LNDLILERITAPSGLAGSVVGKIDFPPAFVPTPIRPEGDGSGPLPTVDSAIVMYTTAEAEANADVLTPGVHHTDWLPYTHNWPVFEGQLTGRSPARDEKCMAHYYLTKIGTRTVLVAKSELHLATDAKSLPVAQLFKQIVAEAKPGVVVDTGTAGGVGATEVLGDVVYSSGVKANMAKSQFADESWAQQRFAATYGWADRSYTNLAFSKLIPAAIGDALKPSGYASRMPQAIWGKDVETVGYFAFADTADSYGVVKNDPNAGVEEMDAAAMTLAFSQLENAPQWISLRNASDPEMGGGTLAAQKKQAAAIYSKYGYWTTVSSALACWGLIADM
jgi:nucleoside phosphorylase